MNNKNQFQSTMIEKRMNNLFLYRQYYKITVIEKSGQSAYQFFID